MADIENQPPPPPVGRVLPARLNESVFRAGSLSKEENFVFVAENKEHDLWHESLYLTCRQISGQDQKPQ